MNEGALVFEGAKSLKARPDDGTWILRWDAVPVEGVSYEVFSREVPQSGGVGLAAPKPYNFDSPAALTKDDHYISENLLLKNNTCFMVRLKYPGYSDNNTKELCTGHTAAVGAVVNSKPPVFVSLNYINAAIDKKLNSTERILDTAVLSLQATDFSSSKYAFVSGGSELSACFSLPSANYTEGIPLANDARINTDGSYKVCVELANGAGNKVYGITADAFSVDTAAPVNGNEPLPTFTGLDFVGAASDGYLNAAEKTADTNIAMLNASGFSSAQYLIVASTADCSAQTYSSSTLPKSNHADFTDGNKKICVKLFNSEGGVTFGASGNVLVDLNAPATPATAAILSGVVADNKFNKAEATAATPTALVSYTPSEGTASYAIANNLAGCASAVFSTSVPLSNDERLVHGTNNVVCVKVTDAAGNSSVAASSAIAIDTQEPMAPFMRVAALADNFINIAENPVGGFAVEVNGEPNANFTLSCTSNCTVVSGGTVVAGGSSTTGALSAAGTATVQVKVSASGSFSFSTTLSDSFSNSSLATVTNGTAVLTSPSLTSVVLSDALVNSAEKATSVGVTLTGTTGASYVLSCSFNCTVASGASGTLTAGTATAQISLAASSDGPFRVSAVVSDAAGNSSAASTSNGSIDTTPPTVSISGPSVASISSSQTTVYTVTYADGGSGVTEGNITLSAANVTLNGDATNCTKTVSTTGTSRTISITGCSASTGSVTLTLASSTATDAAGNTAAAPATSAAFSVSNGLPVFTSLDLVGAAADGYLNATEKSVETNIATLTASGFATAQYLIAASTADCSAQTYSSSTLPKSNHADFTDGNKKICVKLANSAGGAVYGTSSALAVDTSVPVAPTVTIVSGADEFINASENPASVSITGENNASYTLTCVSNCTVVSGATGALSATGTATAVIQATEGTVNVSVTLRDAAGNQSSAGSDTATADFTAPTFTSLTLQSPVADGYLNSADAGLTTSIATLSATGHNSANYALVATNITCNSSVTYNKLSVPAANDTDLANGNSYKLCVKLSDAALNTTYGTSASNFTVDKTAPSVSISGPSVASISSSQTTVYTVTYADGGSGVTEGNITLSAANVTLNGDATNCTKTVSTTGTSRTISITGCSASTGSVTLTLASSTATDAAGNTAAAPATSAAFSVSNVAPNLSISSPAANSPISSTFNVQGACNAGFSVVASVTDGGTSASATCAGDNTYSIALSLTGADGSRTIAVSTTNSVGQTVLKAVTVKKDATPPTVTISAPSVAQVKQSASVTYSVTFSDTNGVNATDSSKITLSTTGDASCSRAIAGAGTAGDPFIVTISNCSNNGTVGISVAAGAATDAAGNTTLAAASATSVNVDNSAPTPTITSPAASTVFNNTTVTTALTGACETGLTVSLGGDVTAGQTATCSSSAYSFSSWTLTTGDGSKSVTVSQTDAAGNVGSSAARSFTLTMGPTAPTLTAANVTGLKPTLTGTCDSTATSHSATTTVGAVRSVTCTSGTLSVLVHLPAGSASFSVTATSTKNSINSSSSAVTFTRTAFTCPSGYVGVPAGGVAGLGNTSASANNSAANSNANWWLDVNRDFCVMKYPAKNNNSSTYATSTAAGTPWVSIPRGTDETTAGGALKACKDAGSNYRLISNTQWQTVARNAESVAANWSGNAVGSGVMARGHTDNSPANALANDTDDKPYSGTGNSAADAVGSGWEQLRTQTLSNGEVVWDFGGNVWQWASDNYADLGLSPAIAAGWDEFSNTTNFPTASPTINRLLFAPLGLYTSAQNIGRMYGGSAGAVLRGGYWGYDTSAGLFTASLHASASASGNGIGFRCVFLP